MYREYNNKEENYKPVYSMSKKKKNQWSQSAHKTPGNNEQTIKVGNVVQVHDETQWKLAVVTELINENDGLVRWDWTSWRLPDKLLTFIH